MLRLFNRAAGLRQYATTRSRSARYRDLIAADGRYGFPFAISMNPHRRAFGGIPTVLLPPTVFAGLVVALWTWKCLMMVIFQNKIIYMPGLPPNARRERIEDYKNQCGGIQWREERTTAADGTQISLCVASVNCGPDTVLPVKTVYVLYFQGNASSIPPRLPFLSPVLRMLKERSTISIKYTMVCCSYRGYWTSKGRPSEKGIGMDAIAALRWTRHMQNKQDNQSPAETVPLVLWGQSIGAGVASNLAAQTQAFSQSKLSLRMLILETPFLSIRAMLNTLYPQKWLPYRHLWPFLRNHLDSWVTLEVMQKRFRDLNSEPPSVLILEAGKDELVPKEHGDALEQRCIELGLDVNRQVVSNALHTEVMVRPQGRMAVVEAIEGVGREIDRVT